MEAIENMKTRRSIRKFKPDAVPQELMDKIIEAGLYAPSGMNKQSPIIIAVTDRKMRDEISEMNREIGGWQEGFDPFYGAPQYLLCWQIRSAAQLFTTARLQWVTLCLPHIISDSAHAGFTAQRRNLNPKRVRQFSKSSV